MKNIILISAIVLLTAARSFAQMGGSLDETFATNGISILNEQNLDSFQDVVVQNDQKIVAIGLSFDESYVGSVYAIRFMPDGGIDTEFGSNGIFTYSLDFEALAYRVVINSIGKIILVGSTTDYQDYRIMLIQLNSNGTIDNSFGIDGVATASVGLAEQFQDDKGTGANIDADDNIIVSGSSLDENSMARPIVLRFSPSGVLDTTFGVNGVATIPIEHMENIFDCVSVQADGKIVAAGHYSNGLLWFVLLIARFDTDGTLDTSFGENGVVKYSYSNVDDEAYDMAIAPDGKIVIAGFSGSQDYNYNTLLMRFNTDGTVDETFGMSGVVAEDNGTFDVASGVKILSDGRIAVGGTSGQAPPYMSNMAAWMYHSDGSTDASFGIDGFASHVVPATSVLMQGMDIQADGKIILAGQSRPGGGLNNFIVARLENSITVGILENNEAPTLSVYPNPASHNGMIYLSASEDQAKYANLSFYMLDGRLAYTASLTQVNNGSPIAVAIPNALTNGVYLIRLEGIGHASAASKLIILE